MALSAGTAIPYFGNPAEETADGSTYTLKFKVKFTGYATATAQELSTIGALALRAPGVPYYGSIYPANSSAYCRSRATKELQDNNIPTAVIVTCTFTTKPAENRDEEENPLDKKPDIDWSHQWERAVIMNAYRIQIFQNNQKIGNDIRGGRAAGAQKQFQNINQFDLGITDSAASPFNPQPEADVPYLTCTIVQNLPAFDPTEALRAIGTVNNKKFRIDGENVLEGQAMCIERRASIKYSGKISYREVTTSFLFKNTHALVLQDRGFRVFEEVEGSAGGTTGGTKFGGDAGDVTTVAKEGGEDAPEEVLLDGKGNKLEKGKKPVYLHFDYLNTSDFNTLTLPRERL